MALVVLWSGGVGWREGRVGDNETYAKGFNNKIVFTNYIHITKVIFS